MKIKYHILNWIPEKNRELYTKILVDRVKHPRKYDHVINVPGLSDTKTILFAMGFRFKELN